MLAAAGDAPRWLLSELIGARVLQTTSRESDPQLHEHIVFANRTLGDGDGEWRRLSRPAGRRLGQAQPPRRRQAGGRRRTRRAARDGRRGRRRSPSSEWDDEAEDLAVAAADESWYGRMVAWFGARGYLIRVGVEGCGSYGTGLARYPTTTDEVVG